MLGTRVMDEQGEFTLNMVRFLYLFVSVLLSFPSVNFITTFFICFYLFLFPSPNCAVPAPILPAHLIYGQRLFAFSLGDLTDFLPNLLYFKLP
jgi:hypothetical protein